VNAVLQYLKYTGDFNFVRERLWETLRTIIDSHLNGTVFDIHVDGDGLLSHGGQLTWMDAAVDGKAVTPRAGKAVEVQALWYNALRIMELLANRFDEKGKAEKYAVAAEKAKKSFEKFWNPERNCLFDVISDEGRDDSLRPNQIVAVSLDFSMLDDSRNKIIVDFVQREFLTPFGLRTLVKNDSRYMGVYAGDRRSRDRAYHNGTVWPWLLGPFSTAFVKVRSRSEHEQDFLKIMFKQLFSKQILEASLGTIGEIFDGDPPHILRGCVAQAWSVAEPLRAYVEDVVQDRPRYEMQILQGLR
jgi:predicted glycogen debranching enzyme